jgi:tetratricopeptide (TPR) repeat protein
VAATWYARAARRAGLNTPAEALQHWEKVWDILEPVLASAESVALRTEAAPELLKLGFRQGMSDERAEEIFAEGKAMAIARGDARAQVTLLYGLGVSHMLSGAPRRAVPLFEEAIAVADQTTDAVLRYVAREPLEYSLANLGNLDAALRVNDEKFEIIGADLAMGVELIGFSAAWSYGLRGWTLTDLGRFDEAADAFRRCEEGARRLDESEQLSWTHSFRARMLARAGDVQGALSAGRRAVEGAEKLGSQLALVNAYHQHGVALGLNGEWEAARDQLQQALEIARANRVWLSMEGDNLAALAEAHLGSGDATRARSTAEEAVRVAQRSETPIFELHAHLACARVLLALDGAAAKDDVEAALERALELVHSTGARSYEPQIYVERARLARILSDAAATLHWGREAHRLFTAMGATGHAEWVAKEIGL